MNIYVGNLDYDLQESDLEMAFSDFGNVESVKIIKDKFTGRGKGFGFVDMTDDGEAAEAIEKLDGSALNGRNIVVNKAKPPKERY